MKDFKNDPEYVQRRRRIIREHHPDAGGSDERLITELRKLDEEYARRVSARGQFESIRPEFISDEQMAEAVRIAEGWAAKIDVRLGPLADKVTATAMDGAADLKKRADEVRVTASKVRASTAEEIRNRVHDTPVERVARNAGRAVRKFRSRFDR